MPKYAEIDPSLSNNRCLAKWATVVCQTEELSTHWISLYLSYSPSARSNAHEPSKWAEIDHLLNERMIFFELMTSDRKLKASREGSK